MKSKEEIKFNLFYKRFCEIGEIEFLKRYPLIAKKYKCGKICQINTKAIKNKKSESKRSCIVCNGIIKSNKGKYCSDACRKKVLKKRVSCVSIEDRIITRYSGSDKIKGRVFGLSKEWVSENIKKPCFYCGRESTGFDRIDNNIGHTEENCLPCCRECNSVRNNIFSHSEMILIGKFLKENIYPERLKIE